MIISVTPGAIGRALEDKGIDAGYYFKSDSGSAAADSALKTKENRTLDFLDDDIQTPPTTSVVRTSGNTYEGFIVELREDAAAYQKIVLYGRVRIVDVDPYKIKIYAYNTDGNTIDTGLILESSIPASVLQQKVKWVELDVTQLAIREIGDGKMKFRIFAPGQPEQQENKRFQFSELHVKVG